MSWASRNSSDGSGIDPADWIEFRRLGHELIDEIADFLSAIGQGPVWQPPSAAARAALAQPLPESGRGVEAALRAFRSSIFPYPLGNVHPRFWGWVVGSGDPTGILADLLASTMNPNVFDGDHAATLVEHQVLRWSREMLGLPSDGSGVLTSGCAVANLVCLAVARERAFERGFALEQLTLYASTETHNSIDKSVRLLGLAPGALRRLPASKYQLDVSALEEAVARDREAGLEPFCVVANAGTVNTGAIDPLCAAAGFCEREGLWLHVDGAFGALAYLVEEYRPQLDSLARADSLAFDFHKWMYAPYAVACALTRHPETHASTFQVPGAYLAREDRGIFANRLGFGSLGVELGRDFRALKIWLALTAHGRGAYARAIEENIRQARYLKDLIGDRPDLELCAPVSLNIVCFRAVAAGVDGEGLDRLNREIMLRVQESGVAVLSSTRLEAGYVLRVAITNHRSRQTDFELLVREVIRHRNDILAGELATKDGDIG